MLTATIDLGTTGVRAIVYDEALRPLGERYTEYPLITLSPTVIEQDAELWWRLGCEAVRGAMAAAAARPEDVTAVGVSSQSITLVPVDERFVPLRGAISWLDRRAGDELARVLERFSASRLYGMTGKLPSPVYTLPKLLWLMAHEPEIVSACRWLLSPHDLLMARMTGRAVSEHTLASGTMLYDLSRAGWSDEIAAAFDLPLEKMPPLLRGGEPVGSLTPEAAEAMGLSPRAVVHAGGQDQKCASLATGLASGIATVSLGTASAIETIAAPGSPPCYDSRVPAFAYFSPGQLVQEGVLPTAGAALRWLRDTMFRGASYTALDDLASRAAGKTRAFFFPYLSGEGSPGWDTWASARFHGLSLETGPEDLVCAVLEGVAFEIYRNLAAMGGAVDEIRVFGGGAKSALWRQIIADTTDRPVAAMETCETACLGAAMLAARGAGAASKRNAASKRSAASASRPDPSRRGYYTEKYAMYLDLYGRNQGA